MCPDTAVHLPLVKTAGFKMSGDGLQLHVLALWGPISAPFFFWDTTYPWACKVTEEQERPYSTLDLLSLGNSLSVPSTASYRGHSRVAI